MLKKHSELLIYVITTCISSLGILAFQNNYYHNHLLKDNNVDYARQEEQLKAEAILQRDLPSFGFRNLIADWAYLKYVQYFGDTEARDETGYSVITDYFKTMIEKDPRFIEAYLSLSTSNSIFAGEPEKTVALLEESIKSLNPNMPGYPFLVFAYKAVDEILFLGDLEAAQKSYQNAARWAEASNDKTGNIVANNYRKTVDFLETNPDSTATQIAGWTMILQNNVSDPKIRKYAMQKIRELGGEIIVSANGEITVKPPKKDV